MRPYEVMIILDPTLEDDAIRVEIDRSTELIRSRGGNPGRVDKWGKRRLAYEIARHREGYYVLLEAAAEPEVMAELHRTLQLADGVLRHKVIRLPDRVPSPSAQASPPPPPSPRPSPPPAPLAAEAASSTAPSTSANGA
jgi:small subunit ribosomal protein S6